MTLAVRPSTGPGTRLTATVAQALMGAGALYGGYSLVDDAEGFGMDRAWLHDSPFEDYLVPGLLLLTVIGLGNSVGAALAIAGHRSWPAVAVLNGLVMFAWLAVETAIVRWQGGPQGALLVVFGASGVVMLLAGARGGGLPRLPSPSRR